MGKIRDFIKKNQKKILIIDWFLIMLVFVLLIFVVMVGTNGNNQKELEKELEKLGRDFYENKYYTLLSDNGEERATFLKDYEISGIKFSLETLKAYQIDQGKTIDSFINTKDNVSCNTNNTRVIVYPKSSYGKTDYKIEVELDCGF